MTPISGRWAIHEGTSQPRIIRGNADVRYEIISLVMNGECAPTCRRSPFFKDINVAHCQMDPNGQLLYEISHRPSR